MILELVVMAAIVLFGVTNTWGITSYFESIFGDAAMYIFSPESAGYTSHIQTFINIGHYWWAIAGGLFLYYLWRKRI